MKKIGFLSFGHWTPSPHSETRSASDALLQSIDLAVAAEELGADGAYFRVHHFARQLGSPFPLLAACGAKTKSIEIGTAVIDMRYENPLYMAEDAGAADLIAGGRLQLGISRGSPEQVIDGWRYFGFALPEGMTDADLGRRHAEVLLEVLHGKGFAKPNPQPMFPNPPGLLRLEPFSEGLRERIWWGAGSNATAIWGAKLGMNLQSSTLKVVESDKPFHVQQAEQIRAFRAAWKDAGHTREPRVSVSRSIFALVDDRDRAYFGRNRRGRHSAADRAQSTRRRLQRPRDRDDPEAGRARPRLALSADAKASTPPELSEQAAIARALASPALSKPAQWNSTADNALTDPGQSVS
jgi:alkanesulfonate monooxygenase SsuD/methylene tetrahydromethanopterin reductase-like flavin-dependent oxidoreductase (luciferase family)